MLYQVIDTKSGQIVGTYETLRRAHSVADRKDNEYGAVR